MEAGDSACIPQQGDDAGILGKPLAILPNLRGHAAQLIAGVVGVAAENHLGIDVLDVLGALLQLGDVHLALLIRVEGDLVLFIIGILQDVQLASFRPTHIAVHHPKGGPHAGTVGHVVVLHGHDEADIRAPSLCRVKHHGAPLEGLHLLSDPEDGAGLGGVHHALVESLGLVEVPFCAPGFALVDELPILEEGLTLRLPCELVLVMQTFAARGTVGVEGWQPEGRAFKNHGGPVVHWQALSRA
mmetsp:Transcript_134990/g.320008  ORF Transcript_134990/g.320008 Transcript_134990/m.320008 type:complete len:243 (-) Transcript_134990:540-1268(-)